MKLGDKVAFRRYYRKANVYVDPERLTEEQDKELEDTEQIVLKRIEEIELTKPLTGIICGKRKMAATTTFGFADNRYNPEADPAFRIVDGKDADVYLVAVNLSGFYRVPTEWLEVQDEGQS